VEVIKSEGDRDQNREFRRLFMVTQVKRQRDKCLLYKDKVGTALRDDTQFLLIHTTKLCFRKFIV
jgi:hypothetical protein